MILRDERGRDAIRLVNGYVQLKVWRRIDCAMSI